jgi:hypothetical protein
MEFQRNVLEAERDELKTYLTEAVEHEKKLSAEPRLRAFRALILAPRGHFYSPIVDPQERHVQGWMNSPGRLDTRLEHIAIDEPRMLKLHRRLRLLLIGNSWPMKSSLGLDITCVMTRSPERSIPFFCRRTEILRSGSYSRALLAPRT